MANEEVDFIPYAELTPEQKEMVDSADYRKRETAALIGRGVDRLIYDPSFGVRFRVAMAGYGFDRLISDPEEKIQEYVYEQLEKKGLTIEEWIDQNPDMCALDENKPVQGEDRYRFEYQLLDRLKMDCDYILGAGGPSAVKYLHQGSVEAQISKMRELYDSLPDNAKPEWLTLADIERYDRELDRIVSDARDNTESRGIPANELLAEYQAVMVDICRSLGAEPRVDISDPTYYQEVIDNAVAELREPSLKNAVVLKQAGDDALLFTGNNVEPFVVALGYDPERKDWSAGTYYTDLHQAVCEFDKQFGTLGYSYNLSLDDLYPLLEEKGFEPTHENVRALMLNTNDFEGVSEYINESLTRLFDDEIDSCEEVLERSATKTMPEKSFHVRSIDEIKAQQQTHKPQGINPKDDIAMGREGVSRSPQNHNHNLGRSR